MSPQERRGRLMLFTALTVIAVDQIVAVGSIFSAATGFGPALRGLIMPACYCYAVYYFWLGGDANRNWVAWTLVAIGALRLMVPLFAAWAVVTMLKPVGADAAAVLGSWRLGYVILMCLASIVTGLLVRFSPSVIAYLDSRDRDWLRGLADEDGAEESYEQHAHADSATERPALPLDIILAKSDDREMCESLWDRILFVHGGNDADVRDMNETARTVHLVLSAEGMIGNGG